MVVAGSSLCLLLWATRSLLLPLKALLLNFLSLSAALGAVVWIFQEGHLRWLVGDFTVTGYTDLVQVLLVLCVAFGLSMDYELLLLSRAREEYDRTGDNNAAVTAVLCRTGPLITSAAAVIIVVFAGMTTSELKPLKVTSVGVTLAVLIDATLIRMLLAPAVMRLAGRANWWLPRHPGALGVSAGRTRQGEGALPRARHETHGQSGDVPTNSPDTKGDTMVARPQRVCVVGAGMAGLGVAWALDRHPEKFTVHVFETKGRLGGNGCTVDLPTEDGTPLPVDIAVTSFVPGVYHNFSALLRWCGIETVPNRFSYAVEYQGGEYAHDRDSTLKRHYRQDLDAFLRMLRVLRAWNTLSRRPSWAAAAANPFQYVSMRRVLDWWGISTGFRYAILKPISVNFVLATDIFEMPAALFARYFDFFDIEASTPMVTWRGGTREIYRKMTADFRDRVHLDRSVTAVLRDEHGVTIRDAAGSEERFDTVVMACNANQSLLALDRPSAWERALLGRVRYNSELHNHAVVHSDTSVLPADSADEMLASRSNFIRQYGTRPDNYEITYLMHNQQPWIRETGRHCLVTYNPERPVDPDTVVAREWFQHVAYDLRHMNILTPLFPRLQGKRRTWYCGAHTLANSQELALVSGLSVARQLGADFPFDDDREARTWFNFYGRLVQGRAFRRA